jgi:hypothetical protein
MRLEKVVAAMPVLKMTIYLTNSSKNFKAIYWRQSHNLQISTTFFPKYRLSKMLVWGDSPLTYNALSEFQQVTTFFN